MTIALQQQVAEMTLLPRVVFEILYKHVGQARAIGRLALLQSVRSHVEFGVLNDRPFGGLHDRLRIAMHDLRRIGVIICSGRAGGRTGMAGGYWIAAEQFLLHELKKRVGDMATTWRILKRSMHQQFDPQREFAFAGAS